MINIVLHGHIRTKFPGNLPNGDWMLSVRTPREAVHAIEANRPGMFQYLVDSAGFGVEYRVVLDGKECTALEQLYIDGNAEYETIEIIPEVIGASSAGIWGLVAGVVLIIVGIILEIPSVGGSTGLIASAVPLLSGGVIATLAGVLISAGIGLVVGGIEQLLFKTDTNTSKNKASYLFSGQVNTAGQGGPIPLCFGRMITGSQRVSAYLTSVEVSPKTGERLSIANDPDPVDSETSLDPVWDELNGRTATDTDNTSTDPNFAGGGGYGGAQGPVEAN